MENNNNLFDLQIDHQVTEHLSESAKWAKFLAIIGFVMCGFLVIAAIFGGAALSNFRESMGQASPISGPVLAFIYVIGALLYFIPCLYLYRFASKMQLALRSNDQVQLTESFKNMKSCYKFVGILTIVVLSLYILAIIFIVIAAAMNR